MRVTQGVAPLPGQPPVTPVKTRQGRSGGTVLREMASLPHNTPTAMIVMVVAV